MGEKDIQEKILEDFDDVFSDIMNALGFHGEKIVSADTLIPGPTASIYKSRNEKYREQFRDVVKYDTKLGTAMMILGLENQTNVDHDMVFRVMHYDGASYKIQEASREKYPVITLVLYFGMKRWRAPKSIHEAIIKGFPNWKKMIRIVPDYHINLVEVAFLPKEVRELLTSDFRLVADYFHALRTGTVKEFLENPEMRKPIRHVEAMIDFLKVFTRDPRYENVKETFCTCDNAERGEDVTMCALLDYVENKGIEEGVTRGLEQGAIQGAIEAAFELDQTYDTTLQLIMRKFSFDEATAREKMQMYWKGL